MQVDWKRLERFVTPIVESSIALVAAHSTIELYKGSVDCRKGANQLVLAGSLGFQLLNAFDFSRHFNIAGAPSSLAARLTKAAIKTIFPWAPVVIGLHFLEKNGYLSRLPNIVSRTIEKIGDHAETIVFAAQIALPALNVLSYRLKARVFALSSASIFALHFINPNLVRMSEKLNTLVLSIFAVFQGISTLRSATAGKLVKSIMVIQVFAGLDNAINSLVTNYLGNYIFDDIIHGAYRLTRRPTFPALRQFHRDLTTPNLTHEEIEKILAAEPSAFEVNPAHCSKQTKDATHLQKCADFDQFLTQFEMFDWTANYSILASFSRGSDHMREMIDKKLKNIVGSHSFNLENEAEFDSALETLGGRRGITKEFFLANLVREELFKLINTLEKGDSSTKNDLRLDKVIDTASKLLSFLQRWDDDPSQKMQVLADLATRGGECLDGQKRVIDESWALVVGSIGDYKLQFMQRLEDTREQLMIESINEIAILDWILKDREPKPGLWNRIKSACRFPVDLLIKPPVKRFVQPPIKAILGNTHVLTWYRKSVAFFSPFTASTEEDAKLSGLSIIISTLRHRIFTNFKSKYDTYSQNLYQTFDHIGQQHFTDWFLDAINTNPNLEDDQKSALREKFGQTADLSPYHRIALMQFGVLRWRE